MSERAEALAAQLEQANNDLIALVEGLSDQQMQATCPDEGWSVGTAAHHVAVSHEGLMRFVGMLASGQAAPPVTMDMINAQNAQHAQEYATVSKADAVALLRDNGAKAVAMLRSLSDAQLDASQPLPFFGGQPTSTAQVIEMIMIGHPRQHTASIRAAAGA
jgi:uncharacterized damage-inducible protein DinB